MCSPGCSRNGRLAPQAVRLGDGAPDRAASLKVANTIRYVSQPVPGFKSTDTMTSIALVAKF